MTFCDWTAMVFNAVSIVQMLMKNPIDSCQEGYRVHVILHQWWDQVNWQNFSFPIGIIFINLHGMYTIFTPNHNPNAREYLIGYTITS